MNDPLDHLREEWRKALRSPAWWMLVCFDVALIILIVAWLWIPQRRRPMHDEDGRMSEEAVMGMARAMAGTPEPKPYRIEDLSDDELIHNLLALSSEYHPGGPGDEQHLGMLVAHIREANGRGLWNERVRIENAPRFSPPAYPEGASG